jgi:hypothetical protein
MEVANEDCDIARLRCAFKEATLVLMVVLMFFTPKGFPKVSG